LDDWRHHGAKVPRSDEIWLAGIGPDSPALGEIRNPGQLYQNQIAATIGALIGLEYRNKPIPGALIGELVGNR
jgi:hypothetical protein